MFPFCREEWTHPVVRISCSANEFTFLYLLSQWIYVVVPSFSIEFPWWDSYWIYVCVSIFRNEFSLLIFFWGDESPCLHHFVVMNFRAYICLMYSLWISLFSLFIVPTDSPHCIFRRDEFTLLSFFVLINSHINIFYRNEFPCLSLFVVHMDSHPTAYFVMMNSPFRVFLSQSIHIWILLVLINSHVNIPLSSSIHILISFYLNQFSY